MTNEKKFHVGVKALIETGDKLLLMKTIEWSGKSPAHWDIPGGRIQWGHTTEETLVREVEEETGITKVSDIEFYTAVISNIEIPLPDEKVGLVLMVYKVKVPQDSKVKLSEEHTEYEWVDKAEAAKRLSHKYPKEFTRLLAAGASGPAGA